MITRRRGRALESKDVHFHEIEVTDSVETIGNLSSPPEILPAQNIDTAGLELEDLFAIEDFNWTYECDSPSPLIDIGLNELGFDSGTEMSASPLPDKMPFDLKTRSRQSLSGKMNNKNAIAARLNRLKKKEYVTGLEKKVGGLSKENHLLKQENLQLNKRVEELEDETRYLRAVLANESMLAQLLSRLSGVNGMKLSSSLFQGQNSNDHDYALPRKRVKVEEKETSGGVCLHVDKNHVSVEFCTKCAESASTSLKM